MAKLLRSESGWPIMVYDNGSLLYEPTRWLLSLKNIAPDDSPKYTQERGYRLQGWLNFLERRNVEPEEAITDDVIAYRDMLLDAGNANATINLHIDAAIRYYWFCQQKGIYRPMVGWNDFEHPDLQYQIEVNKPSPKSNAPFVIPWLLKTQEPARKPMLSPEDVRALTVEVAKRARRVKRSDPGALEARNVLMIRWLSEGGLRSKEVVHLRVSSLPPRPDSKDKARKRVVLQHGTKYGKPRTIFVRAELIRSTNDFLEFERADLIDAHLAHGGEPPEVFPSTRQPGTLKSDSIGEIIKGAELGITPHQLRSYALFRYACLLYSTERILAKQGDKHRIDVEMIQMRLKEQAGHSSIDTTIRRYVDLAAVVTSSEENMTDLKDERQWLEDRLEMIKSEIDNPQIAKRSI